MNQITFPFRQSFSDKRKTNTPNYKKRSILCKRVWLHIVIIRAAQQSLLSSFEWRTQGFLPIMMIYCITQEIVFETMPRMFCKSNCWGEVKSGKFKLGKVLQGIVNANKN